MKKFLCHKLASSKDKGFITLEILISILIASAFLAVAMQSLVYAMAIKVQAQEKQRANQLISEDLETANELANRSNLQISSPNPNPECSTNDYNRGYGRALWDTLNVGGTPTKNLLSNGGGKQVALERTHVSAIPATPPNSDSPHRTLKIKYQVWDWDGTNFLDRAGNIKDAADEPIAETYVEIIPDAALSCP